MSICNDSRYDCSTTEPCEMEHNLNFTCNNITTEFSMDSLASLLDSKLAGLRRDLASIDTKLDTTKQELFLEMKNEFTQAIDHMKAEFTATTDHLSDRITSFQSELSTVHQKIKSLEMENQRLNNELLSVKNSQSTSCNIAELQGVIDQMNTELNEKDQAQLLNDVEITGVPEYQGESALHIVQALAQKTGITLDMRDVVSAERVGPIRSYSNSVGIALTRGATQDAQGIGDSVSTPKQRPRPLVVRLARRSLRDELLRSARARRGLDTGNIGLPEHTHGPVYFNERLTKANRRLLWKTRQASAAAGWKFVWTREGRIYARKSDNHDCRPVRIVSERDVMRVFGMDPTEVNNK
ncbi:uncharacterized protein LOC125233241 [Leguminivora glycinivorella]|uniref:uncharacterized protein LOC125233241 n=1 Tax=Leguminivora glycinivorella TaxID=1035111 RepID=UPI00200E6EA5|nr:uncharacterized protein LOC125233241 [Leguminivora glycinivorella]